MDLGLTHSTFERVTSMRILLIEDNEDDVLLIREALEERKEATFDMEWANGLERGLSYIADRKFDVVLLDLSLPDSQGIGTFERTQEQAQDVPVVVLTGLDDEAVALQTMRKGAQDYLVKGQINGDVLVRVMRYAVERKQAERLPCGRAKRNCANPRKWRASGSWPAGSRMTSIIS